MNKIEYVKAIEKIIAEHQQIQMTNPPSSVAWQTASKEVNRLAKLILVEGRQ